MNTLHNMTPRDIFGAFACVILWGITFPITKFVSIELAPLLAIGIRFSIMALIALPFVPRPKLQFRRIAMLSTILFAIPVGCTAVAIIHVDSSIAALMTELEVIFAAILSWFLLGERLSRRQIVGLVVAGIGVILVEYSPEVQPSKLWALLILIGAGFFYGLSAVQIRFLQSESAIVITVWAAALAAPQVLLLSWFVEPDAYKIEVLQQVTWFVWGAIVGMAFTSLLTFYLWNFLIKKYSVNQVVPFGMLIPISSLVAGYFLLGESTDIIAIMGGLLTILGVKLQIKRA